MSVCSLAVPLQARALDVLCHMSVPSLPSVSAVAPGVPSTSYMAVPLSLTWLWDTVGIWSLRSYGAREEGPQLLLSCPTLSPRQLTSESYGW